MAEGTELVTPTLDAPITAVTVFRDGARVQRSGTASMAPGRQAVVIGALPANVDPASVRVAARGPGLTLLNVTVRVLGDVALLHGRVRYTTTHDGRAREALYTDTYQRRDRQWVCVAGEVVAQGE